MIDLDSMSILVVDDMKSMRLTIRKMLRNLGIGKMLRFAENGKQGLAVLKETPCDLAIIDWNMPVMNGSQMLNRLRNDKNLRDMPVIMVTAENERDIVSEVAEIEIDAYLLKPLTLKALDQKIRSVVENVNNPDPATQCLLRARELEEEGNLEGAIDQTRQALTHKPSASRILRNMGLLHFKIGKPVIGEKCLLKAISVNRQDIASRVRLAKYYVKKQEYTKASKLYLQILSLSDRHFKDALELGERMLITGFSDQAKEVFSKIIVRSGKNVRMKENVVDLCIKHQEFDFPKRLMEDILRENPMNQDMTFKAGLLYRDTGEIEKAMECFRTVDSQQRGHVEAKLEIAKMYYRQGRILQADDYLNQILRIDPKNKNAITMRRQI